MSALAPSILICEDEPLILIDIEDILISAGYANLTLLATSAEGLEYLKAHTPSLAIVDMHLKDGDCTELVNLLISRDVPFIVASGGDKADVGEVFSQAAWLSKPWQPKEFLTAVERGLEQSTLKRARRPRGSSPRGDFDQSKREADVIIGNIRDAEQRKTEILKALRLARDFAEKE